MKLSKAIETLKLHAQDYAAPPALREAVERIIEEHAPPKSDRVFDQAMALAGVKRCPHCCEWLTSGGHANTGPR